jgi:hypothetical protein
MPRIYFVEEMVGDLPVMGGEISAETPEAAAAEAGGTPVAIKN